MGAWRAGVAQQIITPEDSLWLGGYAARQQPAQGTGLDLRAKVLVLEDVRRNRFVLITTDVLGFPRSFARSVAKSIADSTDVPQEQILLNASHTHSAPALDGVLEVAYSLTEEQKDQTRRYTRWLETTLVNLASEAVGNLQPVRLGFGESSASFAVNRRVSTPEGFRIGANRFGPVDHRVPFLTVDTRNGELLAVVFGYACHCTTLQAGNLNYHGDYAGVAQAALEERFPGAAALFVTGTAGDANPSPRGSVELAERHGRQLANAVIEELNGPLTEVAPRLESRMGEVELPFEAVPGRAELSERATDENVYTARHARLFLSRLDENGEIRDSLEYPIQVVRLGGTLTLVALAGEVVVDYNLRLRRELEGSRLWIAGYSNDVSAYIPSRRILDEGGYEAEGSMLYYGQPSRFSSQVEELIIGKVHSLLSELTPNREN